MAVTVGAGIWSVHKAHLELSGSQAVPLFTAGADIC